MIQYFSELMHSTEALHGPISKAKRRLRRGAVRCLGRQNTRMVDNWVRKIESVRRLIVKPTIATLSLISLWQ